MVRDALAMVRLLNHETRDDPDAPARRQRQRDSGDTLWDIRDGLVSENLRGILPPTTSADTDAMSDYDTPIPMVGREGDPDDEDTELSVRLIS